jgi:hypothetical protein
MMTRTIVLGALAIAGAMCCHQALAQDTDKDGISDVVEHQLLERYRPFFLFAHGEDFNPQDVQFYIKSSNLLKAGDESLSPLITNAQLQSSPDLVLTANIDGKQFCSDTGPGAGAVHTCVSNLFLNRRQTDYRINPLEHPPGATVSNPGRHGQDWPTVERLGNVGLYGHVVPIKLASPTWGCDVRWNFVPRPANGTLYYKVEYWQFFGYNSDDKPLDIGDHEGDWENVSLLIQPAEGDLRGEQIVSVMLYAHGLEFRFDMKGSILAPIVIGSGFEEHRGSNYGKEVDIHLGDQQCAKSVANAQNNVLRMRSDPTTGLATHPMVYLERGSHEFWPTEMWSYYGAPKHDGLGTQILTTTPPNLGEVENPMTEYSTPLPILRFNGLWGAYSRSNTPPPSPSLHAQWTWPADSSIAWLLPTTTPY